MEIRIMLAKQMDIRSNIKKFFDIAYEGEPVFVPRKGNRNVVILSESEYNRLSQAARVSSYAQSVAGSGKARKQKQIAERKTDGVREQNLAKLERIRSMRDNWNGNGAPALPPAVLNKVEVLINELFIQPEIFPTAMGTIQLEYDNARKDHMEIEIDDTEQAEIFIVAFNGRESYENISVLSENINERVAMFYG